MKETVQRVGGAMAGMVIPNIGAFIAWGLITALFIPTGWTPNEGLSEMVGPMIVACTNIDGIQAVKWFTDIEVV